MKPGEGPKLQLSLTLKRVESEIILKPVESKIILKIELPKRSSAMSLTLSPVLVKLSWTKISSTCICFLEKQSERRKNFHGTY